MSRSMNRSSWTSHVRPLLPFVLGFAAGACGAQPPPQATPPVTPAVPDASFAPVAAVSDPLGPRPDTPAPAPFLPPSPEVFKTTVGVTVWLLERHEAPIVSCDLSIPTGASSDSEGQSGSRLRHGEDAQRRGRPARRARVGAGAGRFSVPG